MQTRIRLIRKLADCVDGVDVSAYAVGDSFDLGWRQAQLLVAEGWAVLDGARHREARSLSTPRGYATAADATRRSPVEHLRRVSKEIDRGQFASSRNHRVEDRLLQERHDEQARTIRGSQDEG